MGNCCAAGLVNCLAGLVLWTGKGMWILAKLGFTVTGIAAGSLAALAMSCFGNVQAGSVIARATSTAMTGLWAS